MDDKGRIVIYKTRDNKTSIDVLLEQDTVWLSQAQLGDLFKKNKRTISEHIHNIFKEKELGGKTVVRKFRTAASDGKSYDAALSELQSSISLMEKTIKKNRLL
jgi:hypothetical protein